MTVKVVKGAVVVEGVVTSDVLPMLRSKMKSRVRLELWRATLPDLAFLGDFATLEDVSIVNCKVGDPSALPQTRVRSLFLNGTSFRDGFGFLGGVRSLEELHVLNVRGSLTLPALTDLTALVSARVWGCSGFTDVSALAAAPNLRDVELVATGLTPETLMPLLRHPVLASLGAQFGTQAQQRVYTELLTEFGKSRYPEA